MDAEGEVIGLNVAYIPPQARAVSIGFAIPSPTVIDVVESLLEDGRVDHPFLGVSVVPLTPQIAERFDIEAEGGAIVAAVDRASPAGDAGLRRGDVIVGFDGAGVRTVEDVFAALRRHEPGDEVTLAILREGERREVRLELGERPAP